MINDYEATKPMIADSIPAYDTTVPNDDVISKLNGLIQICKDGQDGFSVAAEGIDRSDLKTILFKFSQERAEFKGELQEQVRSLGGDPEKFGTFTGAVHRGWMDIKSAVTGKDEEAILNECERGEDIAKKAYIEAANFALPENVKETVTRQCKAVLAAHDRVKALLNVESHKVATPST
jgi:uncharacterized protein (TIGR02284 family)